MMAVTTVKREGTTSKESGSYWQIWGISLFGRGEEEVLNTVEERIEGKQKEKDPHPYWIATLNPEHIMKAQQDREYFNLLQKTDVNVPDGIGLIWEKELNKSKNLGTAWRVGQEILKGKHRESLVPGADLMEKMAAKLNEKGGKMFFLGGFGNRAERTAQYFCKKYPKLKIGSSQGKPLVDEEAALAGINDFAPDILLVAYGMKKQEEWIEANLKKIKAKVVMGVGRSFDYYSGDLKRAPKAVRRMGLEWLYSLIKEPKRWRRQLALPKFIWRVLREK